MFVLFYSSILRVYGRVIYTKRLQPSVLSDEVSGIKRFCAEKGIRQFLCFLHLIIKFGAVTNLGILVTKILFTQTREEYEHDHDVNFPIAAMIFKEDPKDFISFQDLFGEILDRSSPVESCAWSRISDTYEQQALWTRNKLHISTCSNHAERFHRTLKACFNSISNLGQKIHCFHSEINSKLVQLSIPGESKQQLRSWIAKIIAKMKKFG